MDPDRELQITEAIRDRARAEGTTIAVRHVCTAAAVMFDATGVGVYLVSDLGLIEPIHATDPVSVRLTELQVVLGAGPATVAVTQDLPVLVADLDTPASRDYWPMFAPEALAEGVHAVFTFPIGAGGMTIGALEIYRASAGLLSNSEQQDAWLFADAAMALILAGVGDAPNVTEYSLFAGEFGERWAEIHQATGMVAAQLGVDLTTAFLRLRAQAFATGENLSQLAEDILARRIRLDADGKDREGP
ncbi:GAF and ANTAR domain-containing protein [Kutzneria sp. CA-103260]|uniref:GAF and ANTAR domain-containing protein n=1 Tax=Kutzneria sp. CA-103260 TaxID=2802641 RepID=UPI001BABCE06|nr:GAF and ANTAR domain-containing protein [Kutzneria sp. CA-103260]QUQ64102.1 ANTAR domain-containing protein [Kutzneria sp. CA-103260]